MNFEYLCEGTIDTSDLGRAVDRLMFVLEKWNGSPIEFDGMTLMIIDGNKVRKVYPDFTDGGNGFKYDGSNGANGFKMPRDEIWVDMNADSDKWKNVALREFCEAWLVKNMNMSLRMARDRAHNIVDKKSRNN